LANGLYSATLVFQAADAVPQFIDVPVTFAVGPTLGALPVLAVGGVVNAASFALNKPVSPGALVSIFGNHFTASAQQASKLPLATFFNGVNVTFNGIPAPLLFVGATQINAQVPYGVTGSTADVQASTTDGYSNTITVPIAPATPGIISQSSNGSGPGVITDAITGALITAAAPIPRGGIVTIYGVGNGPVSFRPGVGAGAPSSPLAQNTNPVTLSIGGITVSPLFAGLAPGFVGLNQINAVVPTNAPTGSAVPVFVTASGITSNVVTMAIK
jgi:adhesin/invasin